MTVKQGIITHWKSEAVNSKTLMFHSYMYVNNLWWCTKYARSMHEVHNYAKYEKNISLVVKIRAFQDFYFMPCILINMHDIDTKTNRDHLRAMGYLGTTYVMYPTYRYWDFVFTSFFRQNHIKLRPLCILMIFNILI